MTNDKKFDYAGLTLEEQNQLALEEFKSKGGKVTVIPTGQRSESADPKSYWGGRPKKKAAEVETKKR